MVNLHESMLSANEPFLVPVVENGNNNPGKWIALEAPMQHNVWCIEALSWMETGAQHNDSGTTFVKGRNLTNIHRKRIRHDIHFAALGSPTVSTK